MHAWKQLITLLILIRVHALPCDASEIDELCPSLPLHQQFAFLLFPPEYLDLSCSFPFALAPIPDPVFPNL
jgi:hypothetical protein